MKEELRGKKRWKLLVSRTFRSILGNDSGFSIHSFYLAGEYLDGIFQSESLFLNTRNFSIYCTVQITENPWTEKKPFTKNYLRSTRPIPHKVKMVSRMRFATWKRRHGQQLEDKWGSNGYDVARTIRKSLASISIA